MDSKLFPYKDRLFKKGNFISIIYLHILLYEFMSKW